MRTVNLTLVLFILTASVPVSGLCAILIESRESEENIQKTWVEGNLLRAETAESTQYMLMDFTGKKMYLVSPEKKQALDMSGIIATLPDDSQGMEKPDFTVTHPGSGPEIAGYPTEHYIVSHNGKKCVESFTSRKVANDFALQEFIVGMKEMFPQEEDTSGNKNPCAKAEDALDYQKIGIPLRVVEEDGEDSYLIVRLKKNAQLPEGGFSVPAGFHIIDYNEMILRMSQQPK